MNGGQGVTLSWAQIIWGITIVFILGGTWVQLDILRRDVADMKTTMSHLPNSDEYNRVWEHIGQLEKVVFGRIKSK